MLFGAWPLIYGAKPESRALPFTHTFLRSKGVDDLAHVDHSEWGWMSLFNILRNPDIPSLDVSGGGSGDYAPGNPGTTTFTPLGKPTDPPGVGGDDPTFLDVLNVLNEHPTRGVLDRSTMKLQDFIDRALAIMPQHDASETAKVVELLDPHPSAPGSRPPKLQEPKPQASVRRRQRGGSR